MRRPLVAFLVVLLSGCASAPAPSALAAHRQPSVCLVTSAGPGSETLNQSAQDGIAASHAVSDVVESPVPAVYAANLERCATGRADLTVALSAGMAGAIGQVARRHPSLRFALVDAMYLVGVLAGLMESMKVGRAVHNRVGGFGVSNAPASQRYLAGFIAGARSVNPNVGVKLDWTAVTDQAGCKAIGTAQVRTQVDILFQAGVPCGPSYIEAAYDGHAYAIGSGDDQATLSPAVITSAVKRVDRALQLTLERLAAGTFTAGPVYFGVAEDAMGFAQPSSVVPQSILIQLGRVQADIRAGTVTPPAVIPAGI
jgi:basic membrane protein A